MSRLPLIDVQAKPDPLTLDQNFRVLREKFNGAINSTDIATGGVANTNLAGSIASTKLQGAYARGVSLSAGNTTAETNLVSQTVTGGDAVDRLLRLTSIGSYANTSGAGATITFRFKFGATTLWGSVSGTIASAAVGHAYQAVITLGVSAGSQVACGVITLGSATLGSVAGVGAVGAPDQQFYFTGSSSVDATVNQTLGFTAQHSVASANIYIAQNYATIELI